MPSAKILPSSDEKEFLVDYFQGFSRTFLLRYGKVDLEGLFSMYAPLHLESMSQLCIKNRDETSLNSQMDNMIKVLNAHKTSMTENFAHHMKPDFLLQITKDSYSSFKILKLNHTFFLVENNICLNTKAIVNFHNEKKDYFLHQENFIILLKELTEIFA